VPVEPFTVHIEDSVLQDLMSRIRCTRWPESAQAAPWEQGTDLDYLKDLLSYWTYWFDWRSYQEGLNKLDHFQADIDGVRIHFVHEKAKQGNGIPLILTHGWPSCFLEYLPLIPSLTEHFDLVIPSLPGYGFSERPAGTGVNYRHVAGLWHRLMRELGYSRYGAVGGDFGAGVSSLMALDDPSSMIGIYLSTFELDPYHGPESTPLSKEEVAFHASRDEWAVRERGYSVIQSTKPQTLAYGLADSPAGLAAWILEKWRSWTDSGGDLDSRVPRDFLLAMLTVYWATGSIATSIRDYWDNRWSQVHIGPDDYVTTPTAFGLFTNHFIPEGDPPREWLARLYNVARWTPMAKGGHFAAIEEPELAARDITEFFTGLGEPRA
jgi:pimeloyl-ACP methyl ester carboxylesterase